MRLTGRTVVISASAALVAATAIWAYALLSGCPGEESSSTRPTRPVWAETHWPFPVDPWGKGKAFRCEPVDCGGEVQLYIRPKLGFCNCTNGIADDVDLDRMGDLDLIGGRAMPIGPGRPITVGSMQGRSRVYSVNGSRAAEQTVISAAFNERCDMVTATALIGRSPSAAIELAAVDF